MKIVKKIMINEDNEEDNDEMKIMMLKNLPQT